MIDIDHFKEVNDFGGHDAGDEMLAGVARCLGKNARAEDVLGPGGWRRVRMGDARNVP